MLSALLQAHVEEVFQACAKRAFPSLNTDQEYFRSYWKQMKQWGNPSDANIKHLFMKIGVPDVFVGLSWQGTTTSDIRRRLGEMNQIRNQIAHGARHIKLNNNSYSLTLAKVTAYRNLVGAFGTRFTPHAERLVQAH